tara:strand:- start:828 stop:980 length:153 start_codon:yes stop_codon:yes gene_type:complete
MEKYTVYLFCEALAKGAVSIVESSNLIEAKKKALGMYPGYVEFDPVAHKC